MICPSCNHNNGNNGKFCAHCGANIRQIKDTLMFARLNAIIGLPTAGFLFVLWMLFGGLMTNLVIAEFIQIGIGLYIIFSILFLFYAIYLSVKNNRKKLIAYWLITGCFLVFVCAFAITIYLIVRG